MPEDDQPPEDIWLDSEAIAGHFEYVRQKWAGGNDMQYVPDPKDWDQNEVTQGWR